MLSCSPRAGIMPRCGSARMEAEKAEATIATVEAVEGEAAE